MMTPTKENRDMTTRAAADAYLAEHLASVSKNYVVYNPQGRLEAELPVIYGMNTGGSSGWCRGAIIAEDGEVLGGHTCSHEDYMPADLGVLEGSRPDLHERFRAKYPDGYRMDFVSWEHNAAHEGLNAAFHRKLEREREANNL